MTQIEIPCPHIDVSKTVFCRTPVIFGADEELADSGGCEEQSRFTGVEVTELSGSLHARQRAKYTRSVLLCSHSSAMFPTRTIRTVDAGKIIRSGCAPRKSKDLSVDREDSIRSRISLTLEMYQPVNPHAREYIRWSCLSVYRRASVFPPFFKLCASASNLLDFDGSLVLKSSQFCLRCDPAAGSASSASSRT